MGNVQPNLSTQVNLTKARGTGQHLLSNSSLVNCLSGPTKQEIASQIPCYYWVAFKN